MTIKMLKQPPDGVKLFLGGRLDANTAPEAGENFQKMANQFARITLDLGELEYISSAGLRSILSLQKQVDRTGGDLTFTNIPPAVAEVFELTGFNAFLKIE